MSGESFDEVLRSGSVESSEVAAAPEPGETTEKVEAEAAASEGGEEAQDQRMVPLPALQEERRKRQELSSRLESMERYLEGMQVGQNVNQQAQVPEDPFGSDEKIYEDIPAAMRSIEGRIEKRFNDALKAERYSMSEATAKGVYDDYDEVINEYVDYAKANPHIAKIVDTHQAPALEAYKIGKKRRQEKTKPGRSEADIQKEVERRVAEELDRVRTQGVSGIPASLAGQRGTGAVAPVAFSGPPSLEELFKR